MSEFEVSKYIATGYFLRQIKKLYINGIGYIPNYDLNQEMDGLNKSFFFFVFSFPPFSFGQFWWFFKVYTILAKKYFTYNHLPLFLHVFMIKIVICSMKLVRFYNFLELNPKKTRNCLKPITDNCRDQSKVSVIYLLLYSAP